jgi:heat shock protein HslJ
MVLQRRRNCGGADYALAEGPTMTAILVLAAVVLGGQGPAPALPQSELPSPQGEWAVEIIGNIKVMPDSRVTMRIEGQTISGTGPCNSYRGAWTAGVAQGVKVGPLLKTMKTCDRPRMSEEEDFFALLADVIGYEARTDRLILRTRTGKTITARRTSPTSVP